MISWGKHIKKVLIVTAVTIILSRMVTLIPLNVSFFASSSLADINQYDIYSELMQSTGVMPYDDKIIVVTLPASADRFDVAEALNMLSECNPAAISIDIHLEGSKDPEIDSLLIDAIKANHNVVFPCFTEKLQDTTNFFIKPGEYDIKRGFVNLDNRNRDNAVIRSFIPFYTENGDTVYSLALEAIRQVYPEKIEKLKSRDNGHEYINFLVDIPRISYTEIPEMAEMITDRIVLLGVDTQADVHRISIDPQIIGLMIHAYAASTVINERYIDTPGTVISHIIELLIILFFVHCTIYFYGNFKRIGAFLVRTSTYLLFFILMIGSFVIFAEWFVYLDCGWFLLAIAFAPWALDLYNVTTVSFEKLSDFYKRLKNRFYSKN